MKSLTSNNSLLRGDVIISINNTPVDDIIKRQFPLIAASNNSGKLRNIANRLFFTNDSILQLTINRKGSFLKKEIRSYALHQINFKAFFKGDICFRPLPKHTLYIKLSGLKTEYIPGFASAIINSKTLIIDARGYPSDFTVLSLSKHLMYSSKEFARLSTGSINQPGLFTLSRTEKCGEHNPNYFRGKVIILVNQFTQSSAEYHVMAFKPQKILRQLAQPPRELMEMFRQ